MFLRLVIVMVVVFFFYLWTATGGYYNFASGSGGGILYNELAKAFLKGQLHLLVEAPEELIKLPDPYDPKANWNFMVHLWDVSLYKNKFYVYFGPTPVITLYIPYMLITEKDLSYNIPAFVFACGSFVFAVLILVHLWKRCFMQTPRWMVMMATGLLGFASVIPYCLRYPEIYEVAILSGLFFLIGAIYFLILAFVYPVPSLKALTFASIFLGLGVGCRPQIMLSFVLLFYIFLKLLRDKYDKGFLTGSAFSLFLPFAACVSLLGWYNFERFGSTFDFGTSYMLAGIHAENFKFFDFNNIPISLYFLFVQNLSMNSSFPYFHLDSLLPGFPELNVSYGVHPVAGLFNCVPFLLILFFAPTAFWLLKGQSDYKVTYQVRLPFPHFEFYLIIVPACLSLFIQFFLPMAAMRYYADFAVLFILACCIMWFYFDSKLVSYRRFLARAVTVVLVIASILIGMALSVGGRFVSLKNQNPKEFEKLESFFKPLSNLIFKVTTKTLKDVK